VCGASYHTKYKPSKDGATCDHDGTVLTLRKDDSPEVVLNRLKTYHEVTEPLKDYYQSKGKLKIVIGQEEVSDTTKLTIAAIDSVK
jgi:adenylate kinase